MMNTSLLTAVLAATGWWLSLKPDDSFLAKLHPFSEIGKALDVDNRFGGYNERTLGFLVVSGYFD